MAKEIDLSSLDLRYEGHRMKNPGLEERLLVSIAQRGIEEPLEGVQREQANILLNGFKRYRCAHKLQLRSVPYASLGEDEVGAIMNLLRISNNRALSILEQAAFIDELYASGCLSVAEMAKELSPSKSWECLAEYPMPADGVTNQRFSPPGLPTPPCQPNNRRYGCEPAVPQKLILLG
jgi:hypothetical protein